MSLRTAAAHRNLLYLMAMKELRTRYKKSVLGWLWSLLNPLVQMAIFSVIFLVVFVQPAPVGDPSGIENFPLYFLCGFIPFNFFAVSVATSIGAMQSGAQLVKKVAFPHEHLVFAVVVAQGITVLIELSVLSVALLVAGNMVLPWLVPTLAIMALLAMATSGVALAVAAMNVFFHDVAYLWTIVSQLLFYSTPIIWNPASVDNRAMTIIAEYGPTGAFITALHDTLYDLRMPDLGQWGLMLAYSLTVFAIGAWVFGRLSPKFAEEL
jgi:ABC-type polysaccharide/polyol phosphate export permease